MSKTYTYLALGDSYTIGEGVPLHENFPYQAVQLLRRSGNEFHAPEIIAKTGWTTSELASHLDHTILNKQYDFVTLLIGVNNQYRGMSSSHYTFEFEELIVKCISLCGENSRQVIVLSIPDWGVTPYAKDRDRERISKEIALFNRINNAVSRKHAALYVDTSSSGTEVTGDSWLAADGLHPSGKAYFRWAKLLTETISSLL